MQKHFKEAGWHEELGNGILYMKLLKKMTEQMLSQYNRWVYENKKVEGVETIQEAEFQTVAVEILRGLASKQRDSFHTLFGKTAAIPTPKGPRSCRVCKKMNTPYGDVISLRARVLKSVGILQCILGFATGASEEITMVTSVHVTKSVVRMDVRRDMIDCYTKRNLGGLTTTTTKQRVTADKQLQAWRGNSN